MHNGLRPRFGPPDRIRYVLFAGPRVPLSIHIPDILSEGYLELLQLMPKATGQVINPIAWHKRARSVRCFRHVDFGVTFDDAPLPVIRAAITSAPTTVILLNSRLPSLWQAIRQQAATCLVCSADEQLGVDFSFDSKLTKIYCATFEQLIAKLMRRIARLSKSPAGVLEGLIENRIAELVSILERLNDRTSANFLACRPNDHTFLQLLAPYGRNILKLVEIAHAERPEALVKSALRILRNYNFLDKKVSRQGIGFPDYNPPLILSWPYYGPNHKELFKSLIKTETGERKAFLKTMGEVALGEQTPKNYDYRIRGLLLQNRAAVHAAISEFQVKMVRYMDNVGYLHASFQDSPVLRMPLTGKTVNEPLASFQASCVGVSRSDKRAHQRLHKVGRVLGSRFPKSFLAHIDGHYDQLVAITDIPIEWTTWRGVPLGFLIDICRLPQSNPTSVLAQYSSNVTYGYSIKSNILEKTLVVCGADATDPIGKIFDTFVSKPGVHTAGTTAVRCLTKADFLAAIEHHQPDLLIVDSHGNFETNQEGSYLKMGKEKVLGDDILLLQHSIPLVILSCCLSAPLYGCSNTIAQAFFEKGSRSVLSTFLPISADRGYLLYQRILKNLSSAVGASYHRNWLSFISHNLRTSHFDDYLFPLREGLGEIEDFDRLVRTRGKWIIESMNPSKRRQAYFATKRTVVKTFRPALRPRAREILKTRHIIPEAFYYTHLGRADLVQFDVWLENETSADPTTKSLYEEIVEQWCI